jgi:hypothetical protein
VAIREAKETTQGVMTIGCITRPRAFNPAPWARRLRSPTGSDTEAERPVADYFGFPTLIGPLERTLWALGRSIGELHLHSERWWAGDNLRQAAESLSEEFRDFESLVAKSSLFAGDPEIKRQLAALRTHFRGIRSAVSAAMDTWEENDRHNMVFGTDNVEQLDDAVRAVAEFLNQREAAIEQGAAWFQAGLLSALAEPPKPIRDERNDERYDVPIELRSIWHNFTKTQRSLLRAFWTAPAKTCIAISEQMNWKGERRNLDVHIANIKNKLTKHGLPIPWKREEGRIEWAGFRHAKKGKT